MTKKQFADKGDFHCEIMGMPEETFTVKTFTGKEHGLSADYTFTVSLTSDALIKPKDAIGQKITLYLENNDKPHLIHGIVTEFSYDGQSNNVARAEEENQAYGYTVLFASPLQALKLNHNNRIFCNQAQTVIEVIETVLDQAMMVGLDYVLNLEGDYPTRKFIVQYDESDYDFLMRIMARAGIFFRFEQEEQKTVLYLEDQVNTLPIMNKSGSLPYELQSAMTRDKETIFGFRPQAHLKTADFSTKDYNYETPAIRQEDSKSCQGGLPKTVGTAFLHGENIKSSSEDDGLAITKFRMEEQNWGRQIFVADSDCRAACPGKTFTLTNHPDESLNTDYLVIEVEHGGDQSGGLSVADAEQKTTYYAKLRLIKKGVPYRPHLPDANKVHTSFTAKVETRKGPYALLDEQGRYRLRFDLDNYVDEADAPHGEAEASHDIRMMQPHGGRDFGFHFPLHKDTEVAVSCINGDLDRPIIIGVLPNPHLPSPINSLNPSENTIRTFGGNELLMDDFKGKEKTELFTRERKNILSLDADRAGHKVSLVTEDGEMEIFAGKTMLMESGDSHIMESGADHKVTIENKQQLQTVNKEIEHQAATDINLTATDHILIKAETENTTLITERDFIAESGESFSTKVESQNMDILVEQGSVNIKVANAITVAGQGGGTILLSQGEGGIAITEAGDLILDAPSITINAPTINITTGSTASNSGRAIAAGGGVSVFEDEEETETTESQTEETQDSDGQATAVESQIDQENADAVATADSTEEKEVYDEKVQAVCNRTGFPIIDYPFFIKLNNGKTQSGYTDENGKVPRIETESSEEYSIYWGDEALARIEEDDLDA